MCSHRPKITEVAQGLQRNESAFDLLYKAAVRTNNMRKDVYEKRDLDAVKGPTITEVAKRLVTTGFQDRLRASVQKREAIRSAKPLKEDSVDSSQYVPMITARAAALDRDSVQASDEWLRQREIRRANLANEVRRGRRGLRVLMQRAGVESATEGGSRQAKDLSEECPDN